MAKPSLIFTRDALRELDRRAVEEYHLPILVLMENAGRAVAEVARHYLHAGARVLVLAGPGNNGGDGLVAARHLHNAGVLVHILLLTEKAKYRDTAATQAAIIEAMRLPMTTLSADRAELRDWLVESSPHDLVIDALFGTGLTRPLDGAAAAVVQAINTSGTRVLAVDIPSGLDCDSGEPVGGGAVIRAMETVSFCGTKKGFAHAGAFTGKVTVADIGAPRELLHQLATHASPSHG